LKNLCAEDTVFERFAKVMINHRDENDTADGSESKENDDDDDNTEYSLDNLPCLRKLFDKHVDNIYNEGHAMYGTTNVSTELLGGGNLPLNGDSAWKLILLFCNLIKILDEIASEKLEIFWIGKQRMYYPKPQ